MYVVKLQQILFKCEEVMQRKNLSLVQDLLVLKIVNDLFERERLEIKQEFLLKGICSKEVDGLIEEPAYYKGLYIPKTSRWRSLLNEKYPIYQALNDIIKKNCLEMDPLPKLTVSTYQMNQLLELAEFCDFKIVSELDEEVKRIAEWSIENKLSLETLKLVELQYRKFFNHNRMGE